MSDDPRAAEEGYEEGPGEGPGSELEKDTPVKKDPSAGMIGRRVLMPIGLWTEISGLIRKSGGDQRDVLQQLLDLGVQAQGTDRFKPRFVTIQGPVADKVRAYAAAAKVDEDTAVVTLLDLGYQARSEQIEAAQPKPPKGTTVRFELDGQVLLTTASYAVPTQGEIVTLKGSHYEVVQRAWSAAANGLMAYLRLRAL